MSAKCPLFTTGFLGIALLSSTALATGSQSLTDTYDIARINQALQTAVSQVSLGDSGIKNLDVQLDASRTDIDKDIMGFDASLELSRVSFQAEPVKLQAKEDLQVLQASKEMPQGGIVLGLKADVQADSVALMKYVMKKKNLCEKAKMKKGVERLVADSHCQASEQLATATSVADMKEIFVGMRTELAASLSSFVTSSRKEVATLQNVILREEVGASVQRAEEFLKVTQESKIIDTADGFSMEVGKMTVLGGIISVDRALATFSATAVHLEKDVTVKAGALLYNAAKPEIKALLKGLEAQEACAIRAVTSHMNFDVNLLDAMLD